MGSSQSTVSYNHIQNDFELVIRATKDMEFRLETAFGAPSGKTIGLHDKITHAEETGRLSASTVRAMRYLVTVRNKLVHERNCNNLEDRVGFLATFAEVQIGLSGTFPKVNVAAPASSCVVM